VNKCLFSAGGLVGALLILAALLIAIADRIPARIGPWSVRGG
jgi:hypothetical protein